MSTFSQLVDQLVAETLRTSQTAQIASWLNQTIREVHFTNDKIPGTTQPVQYGENLVEDSLTADVETGFMWTIPNMTRFQLLAAVHYTDLGVYAHPSKPAALYLDQDATDAAYRYYRTGDSFAFLEYGGLGATIDIAYYEYPKRLIYYPNNSTRPAQYDEETETWTYPAGAATDADKLAARALCSNWLTMRWEELITQGTRAKIFARTGDIDKNKLAYASYENLRPGMMAVESQEFIGFYRR